MTRNKWILAPLGILAMIAFTIIGGELVMRLWNWLLPGLFGWRQLNFWQALGLLALCRILFGRLGGRSYRRFGMRRQIEERMDARWERMTPEERERFRSGRCGFGAQGRGSSEPA